MDIKYSDAEINLAKAFVDFDKLPTPKPSYNETILNSVVLFLCDTTIEKNVKYLGEGDYGHIVSIANGYKGWGETVSFEVAYTKNSIRVYSDIHNGFIVPSYFNISDKDFCFPVFKGCLYNCIKSAFGLE